MELTARTSFSSVMITAWHGISPKIISATASIFSRLPRPFLRYTRLLSAIPIESRIRSANRLSSRIKTISNVLKKITIPIEFMTIIGTAIWLTSCIAAENGLDIRRMITI